MKQESIKLARGSIHRMLLTLALMIVSMASLGSSYTIKESVNVTFDDNYEFTHTQTARCGLYIITAPKTGVLSITSNNSFYLYPSQGSSFSGNKFTYTASSTGSLKDGSTQALMYEVKEGETYYVYSSSKATPFKCSIGNLTLTDIKENTEYTTPDPLKRNFYKITASKAGTLTVTNTNGRFFVRSGVTDTSIGEKVVEGTANSDNTAEVYTAEVAKGDVIYIQTIAPDQILKYSIDAAEVVPEYGSEIEFDAEYTINGWGEAPYYTITAPKSGKAYVKCSSGLFYFDIYTDSEYKNKVGSVCSSKGETFDVTGGTKYYIKTPGMTSDTKTTFTFSIYDEETKVELTTVSPENGSVYSIYGTGQFSAKFNMPVKCGTITLTCGTTVKTLTRDNSDANNSILVDVKSTIYDLLSSDAAKTGDKFTITVTGIKATDDETMVYGDDGTLTVEYTMPQRPTSVTNISQPDKFLSYWMEGDEEGKIVLAFDNDLYTGTDASKQVTGFLGYGKRDYDGEYYYEDLVAAGKVAVSGNTITIDLTQKLRTPDVMVPNTTSTDDPPYNQMAWHIGTVYDANGNLCYAASSGNMGSYGDGIPYEEVKGDVDAYFDPQAESDLSATEKIEVYVIGHDLIAYDGIDFTYKENGEAKTITVAKSNLTISDKDEDDGVTITVAVPEAVKTASNVVLSFSNLKSRNGIDYSAELTATYNPAFAVTMLNPTDTEFEQIEAGTVITVTTNKNDEVEYLTMQITDLNPSDPNDAIVWPQTSGLTKNTDATTGEVTFTYEMQQKLMLRKGHQYRIDFVAAASEEDYRKKNYIGSDAVVITGLSKEYEYSTIKFVSIDPDPDETSIESYDQNTFVVTFDGKVKIDNTLAFVDYGQDGKVAFESITPIDEGATSETVYSSKWQLKVSDATMREVINDLPLSVAAEDEYGRRVTGGDYSEGTEDGTYFAFEYKSHLGTPDFTVTPADGSELTEISTIDCEYSEGITPNTVSYKNVKLYNANGEVVAYANDDPVGSPEDAWTPTKQTFTLNNTITTPGKYTLEIPADYFVLGENTYASNSKKTIVNYTIAGVATDLVPESVSPTPDTDEPVLSLSTITLTFNCDVVVNADKAKESPVTIYTNEGKEVTTADIKADGKDIVLTLAEEVTEGGNYRVVVPAGLIGNAEYASSSYTSGSCNAEYGYTYIVGSLVSGENIVSDPAEKTNVESLSRMVLEFVDCGDVAPSYNPSVGEIELRDADGNVVTSALSDIDNNIPEYNKIPVDLNTAVSEPGVYTLYIPAGFYTLDDGSRESNAIYLTYCVGSVDVEIGETGYASLYYSKVPLEVPEGVDAWTYAANGESLIADKTYPTGSVIPVSEGVVLYTTTPDTYTFKVGYTEESKASSNSLRGTDVDTEITATTGKTLYMLTTGSEGVGFYKVNEEGTSFTNHAHRCYLELPGDVSAKYFNMDGGTTGISTVNSNASTDSKIYNIQGQKLNNMNGKGLFIVDGKKIVKK